MTPVVSVDIHPSQFPENVRADLIRSLRARQVNHKFHYDSVKQTQRWLALHQAVSPSRIDPDCAAVYDRSFEALAGRLPAVSVHLVGLGCGGGQKDTRLLRLLKGRGNFVCYTASDVSVAMVLVARQSALAVVADDACWPLVCDLATAEDLGGVLDRHAPGGAARLLTFFGMIPNFEPVHILPRLAALVRPLDWLLFSANLAPGTDYDEGLRRILPQYDNAPTRDWLLTFLLDLGVEQADGEVRFAVEDDPGGTGLKRVVATFRFCRSRRIVVDEAVLEFGEGDSLRLFFSYRYTPDLVRSHLERHGLAVDDQWVTRSGEEGVFLCRRA